MDSVILPPDILRALINHFWARNPLARSCHALAKAARLILPETYARFHKHKTNYYDGFETVLPNGLYHGVTRWTYLGEEADGVRPPADKYLRAEWCLGEVVKIQRRPKTGIFHEEMLCPGVSVRWVVKTDRPPRSIVIATKIPDRYPIHVNLKSGKWTESRNKCCDEVILPPVEELATIENLREWFFIVAPILNIDPAHAQHKLSHERPPWARRSG